MRELSAIAAIAIVLTTAACGGSDDDADDTAAPQSIAATTDESTTPSNEDETAPETTAAPTTEPPGPRIVEHLYGATEIPADPQRIVALSEEFLLADLLSLGVTPVASTSNDPDTFPGIDPALTEGIEVIFTPDFDIEELAALEPDLLLGYGGVFDQAPGGYETISEIAPTVSIGDDATGWREQLVATADVLGLEVELDERLAAIDAEIEAGRSSIEGQNISVLSVFPGPFIRTYTTGDYQFFDAPVNELGLELVPSNSPDADDAGRVVLSPAQLGELQGDTLVLLQSPNEDLPQDLVGDSPVWPTIPGVANDRIIVLDRLGYPGAEGHARFVTDLAAALDQL
ncbi:MAG: ABC transporter substrate-binding protein [Actinomycetota bacterium]